MSHPALPPDISRIVGSLFIAGFDGTEISPNICSLIKDHHVGAVLVTPKNLTSAAQATKLISDLQQAAYESGHESPLLIAIDQENGVCNSIAAGDDIRQFPSAMGVVAGNDRDRAKLIATATAREMKCLGVNWVLGPVLDIASNSNAHPLGVRMMDEDPNTVAHFGADFVAGYHDGGVAACGKHFPSYGNVQLDDTGADIPCVPDTMEELTRSAFMPFQSAIQEGVDSIMVGACAMPNLKEGLDVKHACLSETVVKNTLRQALRFPGVIISECLEVESLHESLGFGQAAIMALSAGCDMLMVCHSFMNQLESIEGVKTALENGILSETQVRDSAQRILMMRRRYTSWSTALRPSGTLGLSALALSHSELARSAYESSVTVVRDTKSVLPIQSATDQTFGLLLLTPLLEPLSPLDNMKKHIGANGSGTGKKIYMEGELTFRELGLLLAKYWKGKILHASYAVSGIRPYHEDLVSRAQVVIVVTADVSHNSYQYAFTKHVGMLCNMSTDPKQFIVVATSSPYDFLNVTQVPTYICTYDYSHLAILSLVKVLFGYIHPVGVPPGHSPVADLSNGAPVRKDSLGWLVQQCDPSRDMDGIVAFICRVKDIWLPWANITHDNVRYLLRETLSGPDSMIFLVKNTSTHVVYGLCITCYVESIARASIAFLAVDPEKRNLGIGRSLYQRAVTCLVQQYNPRDFQLGSDMPAMVPGTVRYTGKTAGSPVPMNLMLNHGWAESIQRQTYILKLSELMTLASFMNSNSSQYTFDILTDEREFDITSHSTKCLEPYRQNSSTLLFPMVVQEMYRYAFQASSGADVMVVRNSASNAVVASALLCSYQSLPAKYFPTLGLDDAELAGILIDPTTEASHVLSYLLAMAIGRCRYRKIANVESRLAEGYLDLGVFLKAGFQILGEFSTLYCGASRLVQGGHIIAPNES
ncbi:glycoside hydrolase superfamily [Aspergillus bertholletiae]|uniref:Glycoside hydrolase superfamily n=1 Tax=Aspergillus bertholletiae TaxID=1226010 RepID=A0A5N7B4E4_9EURO|nr:glycoside hydrolase superfamily [Aspergillus bertholletiae]